MSLHVVNVIAMLFLIDQYSFQF